MWDRRYNVELAWALAAYVALLIGSNWVLAHAQPTGVLLVAIVLSPTIGVVGAAWAILGMLRRMDELQRRIQFEAFAIAFALTAIVTVGWGFLESIGVRHFPTFGIWPLLATGWLIGQSLGRRRYA